jgi:hypothetical protein
VSILQIFPNEPAKNQDIQNTQNFVAFQSIQNWANQTLTNVDVDYKQESGSNTNIQSNVPQTTSTSYVAIPQFSFNFTPKNTLCSISFMLSLQGQGFIGIFVNGSVIDQIPFSFASLTPLYWQSYESMSVSQNKISLGWKAVSGSTVGLACTNGNFFYNRFQVIDFNSIAPTSSSAANGT